MVQRRNSEGGVAVRRSTALMALWEPQTQRGESLRWQGAKGGYFSVLPDLGLKLRGKTEQKTLTGKNLCTYPFPDLNEEAYGITYTDDGDGTITVNGTLNIPDNRLVYLIGIENLIHFPAGTYSFKNHGDVSGMNVFLRRYENGVLSIDNNDIVKITDTPVTRTFSEDGEYVVYHAATAGVSYDSKRIKLQIEKGSTATDYEPYCGGQPSPNPHCPQPIQMVPRGTKVQVTGKNLIPQPTLPITDNGVTYTDGGNGRIVANGTATAQSSVTLITRRFSKETMFFSGCPDGGSGDTYRMTAIWYEGSGNINEYGNGAVIPPGIEYAVWIVVAKGATVNHVVFRPMLTLGETATPWAPYISGGELTTPCDLYEGDIWYPMTGVVERHSMVQIIDGSEIWTEGITAAGVTMHRYLLHPENLPRLALSNQAADASICCNQYISYSPSMLFNNTQGVALGTSIHVLQFYDDSMAAEGLDRWRQHLFDRKSNGNPITVVYPLEVPILEQYAPQPVFAPVGTVNVLQTPTALPAAMEATMLTRRTNS